MKTKTLVVGKHLQLSTDSLHKKFITNKLVIILVIALAFLQLADIVTTSAILNNGGYELNPITIKMVHSWYWTLLKLLDVLAVSTILIVIKKKPEWKKPLVTGLSIVTLLMFIVIVSNIRQLILFKIGIIY